MFSAVFDQGNCLICCYILIKNIITLNILNIEQQHYKYQYLLNIDNHSVVIIFISNLRK